MLESEVIDLMFMSKKALCEFYEREMDDCKEAGTWSTAPFGTKVQKSPKLITVERPTRLVTSRLRGLTIPGSAASTPIGFLPLYEDLKQLFRELIDKDYPRDLYDMQFSLYVDKMLARIELQQEAYGKEEDLPATLFEVYAEQRAGLEELKAKFGSVVTPAQLGG